MRPALFLLLTVSAFASDQWNSMFDGRSLDGWKQSSSAWSAKNGAIHGEGSSGEVYYMEDKCWNCEFRAEIYVENGAAATVYLRAHLGFGAPAAGVPDGYAVPITKNERLRVMVDGNFMQVYVDDKLVSEAIDEKNGHTDGFIAFRIDHGSVEIRNPMMQVLPGPHTALSGTWKAKDGGAELRILDERDGLRYQSSTGVSYFARPDGYDYRANGSPDFDHVSLQQVDKHNVHMAMRTVKLRKKLDAHTYLVETMQGRKSVGRYGYTVSPEGTVLTIEDLENKTPVQTFTRVE